MKNLAWDKMNDLIPAIVQAAETGRVLMLGYMNQDAFKKTVESKEVTFYSRSKKRLWTKGEVSGNRLKLIDIRIDCDGDAILLTVEPSGPVCHTGETACFADRDEKFTVINALETTIAKRVALGSSESYTAQLNAAGLKRMAQKVGEEGVEVALAALGSDSGELCEEAADLLFHLLVLLNAKELSFNKVLAALRGRKK